MWFFFFWQDLGAISNGMFKLKGPTMLKNSYPPAFPLKHQQKDMRLALALGDENAVPMPVAAAANEVILFCLFLCARARLYSERTFS
jgi:3-hydroxyisobutyrate dehydrogenase-like beta-hydroxyacid dehydrogenase